MCAPLLTVVGHCCPRLRLRGSYALVVCAPDVDRSLVRSTRVPEEYPKRPQCSLYWDKWEIKNTGFPLSPLRPFVRVRCGSNKERWASLIFWNRGAGVSQRLLFSFLSCDVICNLWPSPLVFAACCRPPLGCHSPPQSFCRAYLLYQFVA